MKKYPTAFLIEPEQWTTELPLARFFDPARPLEVDVGCGKGRFLLARAQANPETNYLGIDRLLLRLRRVGHKAEQRGLSNVRLIRIEIAYAVQYLLPPASVNTFYIFFPDPWPKRKHQRRRLFTPKLLAALHRTLVPDGRLHIATDHADYFEHISSLLRDDSRFDPIPPFEPSEEEKTDFELLFLEEGATIGRYSCRRRETGEAPTSGREAWPSAAALPHDRGISRD